VGEKKQNLKLVDLHSFWSTMFQINTIANTVLTQQSTSFANKMLKKVGNQILLVIHSVNVKKFTQH